MIPPIAPGDIVVTEFPILGGLKKQRPAIVLKVVPPFDDLLVCGISRQLGRRVPDLDETILSTDDDFVSSGLHSDSLIRLGYLTAFYGRCGRCHRRNFFQTANSPIASTRFLPI